jgi:hypothetical protein
MIGVGMQGSQLLAQSIQLPGIEYVTILVLTAASVAMLCRIENWPKKRRCGT